MATPRFGQERIANIPPLNLLDALYAQGVPQSYLTQLVGMSTPEITSFLLNDNQDRNLLDRAVNMAQGQELQALGTAGNDYDKLKTALTNRGIDTGPYKGDKDANALATWAGGHVNPQVLGNAVATALPGQNLIGGRSTTDVDRQGVTLFSNPQTTPTTTRGIPSAGERGVRGQTVPNAADIAAGTPPSTMAQTAAAAKPSGPGLGSTPGGRGPGADNKVTVDNPANWTDDKIKTWLKQNLGADAYFVDIPDVWTAMSEAVRAGKGSTGADAAFMETGFYKTTSSSARLWYQKERSDPASAAADVAQQTQAVTKLALDQGITIDPTRAGQIAQSYLRYGWTQTDLASAIGAEWHYDPSSKNQAAVVTTMKQQARNWLVPLSDQAIQTWGQGILAGSSTNDQFTQYLRDNAKSLLPQLSDLIDQHQGDPNFTVDHFVDPYRQSAANMLGVQPDQVDFSDPKWRKALDMVDPKTGARRIMSLSEWNSTMKTDPAYGYDKTQNGVQDGMNLAQQLKTSLGF